MLYLDNLNMSFIAYTSTTWILMTMIHLYLMRNTGINIDLVFKESLWQTRDHRRFEPQIDLGHVSSYDTSTGWSYKTESE